MKILYYGLSCDNKFLEERLKKDPSPYIVAQQTFEVAMIEEFEKYEDINLFCNYIPQEVSFPTSNLLYIYPKEEKLTEKSKVKYLSCLNLPFLKLIWLFFSTLFRTLKFAVQKRNITDKLLLSSVNYLPVSYANHIICKIFKIKNVCIFTDSTAFLSLKDRISKMPLLKRKLMPLYLKLVNNSEKFYDGYILFSKYMNELINVNSKPYVVMEGMFNPTGLNLCPLKKEKAIMYAGSLFPQYGITLFLDAFTLIADPTLELWIFGEGEMVDKIKLLSTKDSRIKYMGFRSRSEVFEYEKRASLLINTRFSNDIYTKMSFPSKTFEYMVSGTPYLTTKIGGIPEEYYPYLYIAEDETPCGIRDCILKVFNETEDERIQFGLKARDFILNRRNSKLQVDKIYNFIKQEVI